MRKLFPDFVWLSALLSVSVSCFHKEDFALDRIADDGISYDIALPVADARLTMENLMELMGGALIPDAEGLLFLTYTMDPIGFTFMEDVSLPTVPISYSSPTVPYLRIDTVLSFHHSDSSMISLRGVSSETDVRAVHFQTAVFQLHLENTFDDPITLNLSFPNFFDAAGRIVQISETLDSGQARTVSLSLDGAKLDASGKGFYLKKEVDISINLSGNIQDNRVHQGRVSLSGALQNTSFKRLEGYLGKQEFSQRQEFSIAGLGLERMKSIKLNQVTVDADVQVHGFSAPVQIKRNEAELERKDTVGSIFSVFPEDFYLPRPPYDAAVLSANTSVSNDILDLVVNNPVGISFNLEGLLNPESETDDVHAIEQNAGFDMRMYCRAPLWFSANEYALRDTLHVAFNYLPDETKINYFELKTIVINAFPLEFNIGFTFLDENFRPLFSLCEDRLVGAAPVGPAPALHVTEPVVFTFDDELKREQVEMVKRAAHIALDAKLSTTNREDVKIYMPTEKEGFFKVKMGFRTRVTQTDIFNSSSDVE